MAARRLRAWQEAALMAYQNAGHQDFLVAATPGAGKTTFALALATDLMAERKIDRIIVVAPTDHLRTQWAENANHAGITLDPTLGNDVGQPSPDMDGYVTTYAQVAAKPLMHRARTQNKRTLVILDEIHHGSDSSTWGTSVMEAFEPAYRRLALSGTPFRSKPEERIPFIRYSQEADGSYVSICDYAYGYREALRDGVVRPVVFAAYSGVARWQNSAGDVIAASLAEPSTKEQEQKAWKTVLSPTGRWLPHVVAAADDRLKAIRATGMPDAGAMLLASDQESAKAYAEIVHKVTGIKPVVVLSEDPKSASKIAAFTESDDPWLVSVRLVSEGVDIPRLAVGVWATSYRTPLFFAQAVGRFIRARREGETATIFLPAVRPLLALAAELEEQRNHVIPPPPAGTDLLDPLPSEEEVSQHGGWEALESEAEFAHVLSGGRAVIGDPYSSLADEDAEYMGIPGLLDAEQMAAILARRDAELRRQITVTDNGESGTSQRTAWAEAASLRREINSLISRWSARTGTPHATLHAKVRKAVPGPPSASASMEQLTARRDWLLLNGR